MISKNFEHKVIVITGASSGFGKGVARVLAQGGASLVLAARRGELLEELALECMNHGGMAIAVPTDVSKEEEVARLAQAALDNFGRIDIWINDAGVGALGRFEDIPLVDHVQVIATNLMGTIYGSHYAMRHFRAQQSGTLINLASALGKIPAPYYASYTASKYAIVGLDASLRQELSETKAKNIHVCTVLPMAMDTPFFEHAANYTGHEARPIPPLYDAQKVVDAIVDLVTTPRDEVIVGGVGVVMSALHSVMPGMVEKMMGVETHQVQMKAEAAPPTSGNVHTTTLKGSEMHDPSLKKAS
jgi:short-subunit dehydrogenase